MYDVQHRKKKKKNRKREAKKCMTDKEESLENSLPRGPAQLRKPF